MVNNYPLPEGIPVLQEAPSYEELKEQAGVKAREEGMEYGTALDIIMRIEWKKSYVTVRNGGTGKEQHILTKNPALMMHQCTVGKDTLVKPASKVIFDAEKDKKRKTKLKGALKGEANAQ